MNTQQVNNSTENKHHIEPKMLAIYLGILAVFIMSVNLYSGVFKTDAVEEDFKAEYIAKTTDIEIPGDFPIGLVDGEGIQLEGGSRLVNTKEAQDRYVYVVRARGLVEDVFASALEEMSLSGFEILEESLLEGSIVAVKDNQFVEYSVMDIGESALFVNILYQVFNSSLQASV